MAAKGKVLISHGKDAEVCSVDPDAPEGTHLSRRAKAKAKANAKAKESALSVSVGSSPGGETHGTATSVINPEVLGAGGDSAGCAHPIPGQVQEATYIALSDVLKLPQFVSRAISTQQLESADGLLHQEQTRLEASWQHRMQGLHAEYVESELVSSLKEQESAETISQLKQELMLEATLQHQMHSLHAEYASSERSNSMKEQELAETISQVKLELKQQNALTHEQTQIAADMHRKWEHAEASSAEHLANLRDSSALISSLRRDLIKAKLALTEGLQAQQAISSAESRLKWDLLEMKLERAEGQAEFHMTSSSTLTKEIELMSAELKLKNDELSQIHGLSQSAAS